MQIFKFSWHWNPFLEFFFSVYFQDIFQQKEQDSKLEPIDRSFFKLQYGRWGYDKNLYADKILVRENWY